MSTHITIDDNKRIELEVAVKRYFYFKEKMELAERDHNSMMVRVHQKMVIEHADVILSLLELQPK